MWGVPNLFNRSCVVVAINSLCEAANAWKACMDVRKASTNIAGEMGDGVKGASSRSGKRRSGLGGPNGD